MSTKTKQKRSAPAPKSPKTPKATKPTSITLADGLVSLDTVQKAPSKARVSKFDAVATKLLAADDPKSAVPIDLAGKDPLLARSYIYAAMQRSLEKAGQKNTYKVSVTIENGNKRVFISIEKKKAA